MMAKRDLKADLELCNKASPGPWEFGPMVGELDEERWRANRKLLINFELLNNFREGWPHAIERAIKAEALARELVEALEEAIWLLESYTGRHEDIERLAKELVKAKGVLGDE
jgi:hypothetical protein